MMLNKGFAILCLCFLLNGCLGGSKKSINNYIKGDTPIDKDSVYEFVDILPVFIGNEERNIILYISKRLKYPVQKELQTKIQIEFVVDTIGDLSSICIVNKTVSNYSLIDKEAISIISQTSSKWKPGLLNNNKVKVKMKLFFHIEPTNMSNVR